MTRSQEHAIERIRKSAETMMGHCSDSYEIKQWDIEENEYFVGLCLSVGLKNDEGTMAAVFGRYNCQLFIGKRGGITYPVYKNGKSYVKSFTSLMGVHCDQNHHH